VGSSRGSGDMTDPLLPHAKFSDLTIPSKIGMTHIEGGFLLFQNERWGRESEGSQDG
jgi:hypothetical protein